MLQKLHPERHKHKLLSCHKHGLYLQDRQRPGGTGSMLISSSVDYTRTGSRGLRFNLLKVQLQNYSQPLSKTEL